MPCLPRSGAGDYCHCDTFDLNVLGPVGSTILTIPINGTRIGGLPAGAAGQVLSVDGQGALVWAAPSTPGSHVLATNTGLGPSHTISGGVAGMVLRATGATTAAFQALIAADLPLHNIVTGHNASGLTNGHVLFASGASSFGFRAMQATDIPVHDILTAHNNSQQLIQGQVLTATSINTFGWEEPAAPSSSGAWINVGGGTTDFRPDLPVVISATGVVTEYATIQLAIDAATSGQRVEIPPGLWNEQITLKSGVIVTEMFPGSTILTCTTGNRIAVVTANGGFLQVGRIVCEASVASFIGISLVHSTTCAVYVHRMKISGAANAIGVFGDSTGSGGVLNLWLDEFESDTGNTDTIALDVIRGTVNLYLRGQLRGIGSSTGKGIYVNGTLGGAAYVYGGAIEGTTNSVHTAASGICELNGCRVDTTAISGRVLFGDGDRASVADAVKLPLMYQ